MNILTSKESQHEPLDQQSVQITLPSHVGGKFQNDKIERKSKCWNGKVNIIFLLNFIVNIMEYRIMLKLLNDRMKAYFVFSCSYSVILMKYYLSELRLHISDFCWLLVTVQNWALTFRFGWLLNHVDRVAHDIHRKYITISKRFCCLSLQCRAHNIIYINQKQYCKMPVGWCFVMFSKGFLDELW